MIVRKKLKSGKRGTKHAAGHPKEAPMAIGFEPQPASTHRHDQFEVVADGLGRYTIDISLPAGNDREGARYPVVLVVDGNLLFDVAQVALHGQFASVGGMLPPSIVVGVGYPADEGMASFYARRNYDFHGPWAMSDPLGQLLHRYFNMIKTAEGKPDMEMRAGGYERFMGFLRDELLPLLASRYPIDLNVRHALIGDSSGGHFVLRALYDPASPFRRYVCISPGFGSAEGAIQKAEAEYAAAHDDLDADLFICCGQVEIDQEPVTALCRFGSGVTWIAEQFAIRRWPSARIDWEIMNHEDHGSIQLRAVAAGLRSVHRLRPGVHESEVKKAQAAMLDSMASKS
jgi:predicted alpha/beta superfamily hydrolase